MISLLSLLMVMSVYGMYAGDQDEAKGTVALVVAPTGYQAIEYGDTKKVLTDNHYNVVTLSTRQGHAEGSDGSFTQIDMTVEECKGEKLEKFDGIFLIGGPGSPELDKDPVHNLMKQEFKMGKLVGAICYSPRILAHAGILKDKKATGWNGDRMLGNEFKKGGAKLQSLSVVVDGSVITAEGPASAKAFGQAIVSALKVKNK